MDLKAVMYLRATLDALRLYQKLLSEVVKPYMKNKGLKTDDLDFHLARGREFWVDDRTSDESKTVIRISPGFTSYNVEVLDDNYKDLGEEFREKLAELEIKS